jgi:hypothetical protein
LAAGAVLELPVGAVGGVPGNAAAGGGEFHGGEPSRSRLRDGVPVLAWRVRWHRI